MTTIEAIAQKHGVTEFVDITLPDVTARGFVLPAPRFMAAYHELRAAFPTTGLWPVLLGPYGRAADITRLEIADDGDATTDELTAAAARMDVEAWLDAHPYPASDEPAFDMDEFDVDEFGLDVDGAGDAAMPDDLQDAEEPSALRDVLTGTLHARVGVLLVPVRHAWEVPAVMRFGAWNYDLSPDMLSAMLRRWQAACGAVPVTLTRDVLELWVDPPLTEDAAASLTPEVAAFCPDLIDQGVGTLEALQEVLRGSRLWYFWWD